MKRLNLILLLFLLLTSCKSDNKSSQEILEKPYQKLWIEHKYKNNFTEKIQVYISKNNDTVFNQYKLYNQSKLDSIKCKFYDLKLTSFKPNIYKGEIIFHLPTDTITKEKIKEHKLEFNYIQKNADSTYLELATSNSRNKIQFDYRKYHDNQLDGVLVQTLIVESEDKKTMSFLRSQIFVGNKSEINAILVKTYMKE